MPDKKRTLQQNRIIHSLVNKWNVSREDKAEMVYDITQGRSESTKDLTEPEADVMIKRLGGSFSSPFSSRRTRNYHRQKNGVAQLITPKQEKYFQDLARKRNISEAGFERLCRRMLKKPYPRTTKDANKIIEALKAMNKRDPVSPTPGTGTKEAA